MRTTDEDSGFRATAGACNLSPGNLRPYLGRIKFNLFHVSAGSYEEDNLIYNDDIGTAMHELAHVFGMSKGLFEYFVDPDTNVQLTDHYDLTPGSPTISVEPLLTNVKEYFGCTDPAVDSVPLENEGSVSGT